METNALPVYDDSDNPTGCCPRFDPEGWDDRSLHFEDKPFVKMKTTSRDYIPIDIGPVFERTFAALEAADAIDTRQIIVLSRDLSPSETEHYVSVTKAVEGQENVRLTGDYRTKVFEGPYEDTPKWQAQFAAELEDGDLKAGDMYVFYTTCPKCVEVYGKNYAVAVAALA